MARSAAADAVRRRIAGSRTHDALRRLHDLAADVAWRLTKSGPPPATAKRRTLLAHLRRHDLRVFVETGTFRGDTTAALAPHVEEVFTIELSDALHAAAAQRFARDAHVHVLRGDSATVLGEVLQCLRAPALFWLDAHWSAGETAHGTKESPVEEEVRMILRRSANRDVILIDDARAFSGEGGYPTLDELHRLVQRANPSLRFEVLHDIIRIEPDLAAN